MQVNDTHKGRNRTVILAVVCAILQVALAPNIGIANGRASFAFVFVACVALLVGGRTSVVAGFAAGLFFDLTTTGPIGLMALELTVAGYLMGMESRNRLVEDPGGSVQLSALAALAVAFVYNIAMLIMGQASSVADAVFLRALPTALLTFVAFLPFMYVLSHGAASGPTLFGGRSPRRQGGHFSSTRF